MFTTLKTRIKTWLMTLAALGLFGSAQAATYYAKLTLNVEPAGAGMVSASTTSTAGTYESTSSASTTGSATWSAPTLRFTPLLNLLTANGAFFKVQRS